MALSPAELPNTAERLRLRRSWQCENDDFVVGLLGASTPEKGQDMALAALALLADRLPQAAAGFRRRCSRHLQ